MKRRVIVRQRALLREQEFNVFQRLLASTLSACIFASTLIVQHAQAQMVVSDQSAGSEAIPQGKTKTKKFLDLFLKGNAMFEVNKAAEIHVCL